ncbi:acetyl/propionyl-CoA carboxylase subuit alpha [Mesorhizobium hungaricum]|jgi:acetyl-CoA/propionyl-CoA carboxylase, biotin carboxylase, biotin carboxyl carrier protein|uniref:Acetyl/propionyl-CoA carboxylase subuit alpha n=1 Tax=Mesorhizobium hungaricum TaxID=1566387 RepID=A0A1C2E3F5_9HYPH|nr:MULTISPECIES: biotin carboxylase N-terminal domain-containing protein [Mesorhizobium]MBN9235782.1 ATP-grasp domain-containing protein [Mesorhizobium sp.]MDQ0333124.1 acetyl-CoA/propionyl-CoA carboxylase biotin carboxyl carrier protein [Mesorhizobium sp. YL-MeA3-2017]OCX21446.1 acetyl/propionyl-CoA carboxylase subuit alpha [Mesorhizobium hungaricum]
MKKLLIANRGEIAIRIARAARDYGAISVAIYSDADASSLHVELADEAYGLGPGRPAETYLNIEKILDIARRSGADAVHPGYGFLSERAEFAAAVIDAGLIWVGPAPDVITALGDKVEARRIAAKVGAPLVKGSDGPLASAAEAVAFAREAGLPLAIKAAFGGGGRGMKVARRLEEVGELFESAVREATEAFGRGECYAEQFLDRPRHIEAQIIADSHGNTVVLGTRDCSLQRRNQKLVEEAPAPFISYEQRARIHDAARAICAEAGYSGAGTVEFLLSQNGVISFLEVNTRLQVEHPVTEETTGIDIVIEQLRIADGKPLSVKQTPEPRGHAIEFRINAEDPGRGFLPTPGLITRFRAPSGPNVRVDAGVESGSEIPGLYDSMMAKLIVTGATREQALTHARRALAEFVIEGVASVLPFHRAVLEERDFTGEDGFGVFTNWIETQFRGVDPAARVDPVEGGFLRSFVEIDGRRHTLGLPAALFSGLRASPMSTAPVPAAGDGSVIAPIPGTLQQWLVEDEAEVAEGDVVAVMEAMKMETRVVAPKSGRISLRVEAGTSVGLGAELAAIG